MKRITNWTREDAENFIIGCMFWIGPGFHPDTPMADYVDGNGNPTFDESEAGINQVKLARAYEMLGESIYDLLTGWAVKLGHIPAPGPETNVLADGTEVEVLSPDQAMLLNRYGKLVYWVDDDGHESLIHREAEITEMATRGAWFYAE